MGQIFHCKRLLSQIRFPVRSWIKRAPISPVVLHQSCIQARKRSCKRLLVASKHPGREQYSHRRTWREILLTTTSQRLKPLPEWACHSKVFRRSRKTTLSWLVWVYWTGDYCHKESRQLRHSWPPFHQVWQIYLRQNFASSNREATWDWWDASRTLLFVEILHLDGDS